MWKRTALLICDLQTKVLPHIKNRERIIKNTQTLINANKEYRNIHASEKPPVYVAELIPEKLGKTVPEIMEPVKKLRFNFNFMEKPTYSIFNRKIADILREHEVNKIVISGVQTEWCVARTAIDFKEDGFDVIVASDAVGSTSDFEHRVALENLARKNIGITTTHGFIVSNLHHVEHPLSKWYVQYLRNTRTHQELTNLTFKNLDNEKTFH
jgi:nicotinamidase-related amidase